MSQGKMQKNLVLKKCYLPDGANVSFEQVIEGIRLSLPTPKERLYKADLLRTYYIADIIKNPRKDKGTFVRITGHDEGKIGLIDFGDNQDTLTVEEHVAPDRKGWLSEEIVLYVVDNHVVACNIGLKDNLVSQMLLDIARKSKAVNDDFYLRVSDVPNLTEIDRLNQVGVKYVDFNLTSYLASMSTLSANTLKDKGLSVLQSLFCVPDEVSRVKKRASMTGRMMLSRGRFSKDEVQKDQWLTEIGAKIASDGFDDYTIILEDGTKISTSKLKVSKPIKLKRYANSYSCDEANKEVEQYYEELKLNGSLSW